MSKHTTQAILCCHRTFVLWQCRDLVVCSMRAWSTWCTCNQNVLLCISPVYCVLKTHTLFIAINLFPSTHPHTHVRISDVVSAVTHSLPLSLSLVLSNICLVCTCSPPSATNKKENVCPCCLLMHRLTIQSLWILFIPLSIHQQFIRIGSHVRVFMCMTSKW